MNKQHSMNKHYAKILKKMHFF